MINLRTEIEFGTGLECISGAERAEHCAAKAQQATAAQWQTSASRRLQRGSAAGDLLLMDEADLMIIVQRSLMDRNDRCAVHHLLDIQGRQRRVQLPENGEVVEHRLDHGVDQLSWLITR